MAVLVLLTPLPAAAATTAHPHSVSTTFAARGPFATKSMTITVGSATYDVFRPSSYSKLGFKSPIVTWGNGTDAIPGMYTTLLTHFASYGFTVIASTLVNTGSGREIADAARYLVKANARNGSAFAHHLNVHEVAAVGHSQGATGAVRVASTNPRLIKSVMTFSLPNVEWSFANPDCPVKADCESHPASLTQPVFFLSTHGPIDAIIASPATEMTYFNSVRGPATLGIISVSGGRPADHSSLQDTDVAGNPQGEIGYSTAWLEYTLLDNKKAAAAFTGPHPELLSDANWPGSRVKK
jgi:pimeloyl-ACP methyl ester carboxylesterase